MAIPLGSASRRTSSDLPGSRFHRSGKHADRTRGCPIWSCTGWGLPCHPPYSGCGELLPRLFTLTLRLDLSVSLRAVCFLWHFPSPRGARPLAGILSYGARTFLPPFSFWHQGERPSSLLFLQNRSKI